MEKLFLEILNMSITSSYVIIFIIILRLFLNKFPKIYSYALWSVALFRLICPYSFESVISLLPVSTSTLTQDILYSQTPKISSGIGIIDSSVNQLLPSPVPGASVNPLQILNSIFSYIWAIGIFVLLMYSVAALLRLRTILKVSQHLRDNIFEAENIKTAFVLGFLKPKIYVPSSLSPDERSYIVLHEQTHIKRGDHAVKLIAFLVLCLHWFNPLVWLAFVLMSKDMEMSCDEAVLAKLGSSIKKPYSSSLLSMASDKRIWSGGPIAFGEGEVKDRIKNVLSYKKPTLWVLLTVTVLVTVVTVGLLANPITKKESMRWAENLSLSDIRSIEMIVTPSNENEEYRKFDQEEFKDIVLLVNGSRGRYNKNPEEIEGESISFYITTEDGKRHTFSNMGNKYLEIDGDFFNSDYEWLSEWKYRNGNAPLPQNFFDVAPSDYKPAIMVGGIIYWLADSALLDELPQDAHKAGQIKKVTHQSQPPKEDFEAIGFAEGFMGTDIFIADNETNIFVYNSEKNKYIMLSYLHSLTPFETTEADPELIGRAAAEHYFKSFMSGRIPQDCQITGYYVDKCKLIAGDSREFAVSVISDYNTKGLYHLTANGNFEPDDMGGWLTTGDYREYRIRSLGNNKYEITAMGTGGVAQGLTPIEQTEGNSYFTKLINSKSEYLNVVQARVSSYKNGNPPDNLNHHSPYPAEYPAASDLPDIINTSQYAVRDTGNSDALGSIYIAVKIDNDHEIRMTINKYIDENGGLQWGSGDTFFSKRGDPDFASWIRTDIDLH